MIMSVITAGCVNKQLSAFKDDNMSTFGSLFVPAATKWQRESVTAGLSCLIMYVKHPQLLNKHEYTVIYYSIFVIL